MEDLVMREYNNLRSAIKYITNVRIDDMADDEEYKIIMDIPEGEDDYRNCDDYDDWKGEQIAQYLQLDHCGSGAYREVVKLSHRLCLKIEMKEHTICNTREADLFSYLEKYKPHLTKYLAPVRKVKGNLIIQPLCQQIDYNEIHEANIFAKGVTDIFEHNGIMICDIIGREINIGKLNNKFVIIDYADWAFIKDVKAYKYNKN